jgi:hypothetical protein
MQQLASRSAVFHQWLSSYWLNTVPAKKQGMGRTNIFSTGAPKRRLEAHLGQLFRLIGEYLNYDAVVCPEGRAVTVAHFRLFVMDTMFHCLNLQLIF